MHVVRLHTHGSMTSLQLGLASLHISPSLSLSPSLQKFCQVAWEGAFGSDLQSQYREARKKKLSSQVFDSHRCPSSCCCLLAYSQCFLRNAFFFPHYNVRCQLAKTQGTCPCMVSSSSRLQFDAPGMLLRQQSRTKFLGRYIQAYRCRVLLSHWLRHKAGKGYGENCAHKPIKGLSEKGAKCR